MSCDFMEMQAGKKKVERAAAQAANFPVGLHLCACVTPLLPPRPAVRMQPNDFLLGGPEVNAGGGEEDGAGGGRSAG